MFTVIQIFVAIVMLIGVPIALTLAWRGNSRLFVRVVLAMLMLSGLSLLLPHLYLKAALGEHEDWGAILLFSFGLYASAISLATGLIGWGLSKIAENRHAEKDSNY